MNRRGTTLVEIVIVILLVGIGLPPLLVALMESSRQSVDAEMTSVAVTLGQELLEEIRSKRFDERTSPPWTSPSFPTDPGENPSNKATFDDVDDFDDWSESPVAGFTGYGRRVRVRYVPGTNLDGSSGSATEYKRIEVTVTAARIDSLALVTVATSP